MLRRSIVASAFAAAIAIAAFQTVAARQVFRSTSAQVSVSTSVKKGNNVVANLAASFAEAGREVTVLRISLLGGSAGSSAYAATPTADVSDRDAEGGPAEDGWPEATAVAGVQTLDLLRSQDADPARSVAAGLREEGVVVLVDAGSVATAEFAELAPTADGVITVCEFGKTRTEDAERAADIIAGSRSHFSGVVLAQVPTGRAGWFSRGRRSRSPLHPPGPGGTE